MDLEHLNAAIDVLDAHIDWLLYVDTFTAVDTKSYEHAKLEDEKTYLKSSVVEGEHILKSMKSATNKRKYAMAVDDFGEFALYNTKRCDDFFKWLVPNAESGVLKSTLDNVQNG